MALKIVGSKHQMKMATRTCHRPSCRGPLEVGRLRPLAVRPFTLMRIASNTEEHQPSTSGSPDKAPPMPVPKSVSGLLKSLQDFGIGKNSLKEGGVGLFVLGGCAAAFALVAWARGNAMRVGTPYQLTVELPVACGITIGTPVRIRGVQVRGRIRWHQTA